MAHNQVADIDTVFVSVRADEACWTGQWGGFVDGGTGVYVGVDKQVEEPRDAEPRDRSADWWRGRRARLHINDEEICALSHRPVCEEDKSQHIMFFCG